MKNLNTILILLFTFFPLVTSCGGGNGDEVSELPFIVLEDGIHSNYSDNGNTLQEPTLLKIVSQEELEAFWNLHNNGTVPLPPAPVINFDQEIALVVMDIVMPDFSSVYSLKIDKILEYEDQVVVFATKTRGDQGCVFNQTLSQAYQIVKTTNRDKPFTLSLTETTENCGT